MEVDSASMRGNTTGFAFEENPPLWGWLLLPSSVPAGLGSNLPAPVPPAAHLPLHPSIRQE
jgi:hypothetical protein